MFNETIFDTWLDTKANEIITQMGDGSALSSEQMMVLVLKAQTNHFNHLDVELRQDMKELREDMDKRFEKMDKRFDQLIQRMDSFLVWSFATTLTVGGLVVAAIKLL